MSKKILFPLAAEDGESRVVLRIRAQGEQYDLGHIFRELTAADKKLYWATLSQAEMSAKETPAGGADYLGANEKLYDSAILRVEGYALPSPSDVSRMDWRAAIPLEHKLWAVEELLARAGTLAAETVKN